MKRALPLLALFASAALADPMGTTPTSTKLCDPTTRACANLSTVSGSQAVKVDVVQSVAAPVTGTVTANQGTAGASAWLVTYSAPPHVIVDTAPTTAVTGTFWPTTAAAPSSQRLSDGSAFYDATKTGQLPAALDGSGFLKTHEQGTAAISAAALPLPSGASTSAKQPAFGTAGTASADVITVQGKTGMTSLVVETNGHDAADAAITVNPILIGGSSGTNIRNIRTDTAGFQMNRIYDNVSGLTAAVKPASTAAAAADQALVVAVSPNNTIPTSISSTAMGLYTLLNAATASGAGSAQQNTLGCTFWTASYVTTGSPTSVDVAIQGSNDNSTWFGFTPDMTNTSGTMYGLGGWQYVRGRLFTLSGGSSPTLTLQVSCTQSGGAGRSEPTGRWLVVAPNGQDAAGATITANPVLMGGSDGSVSRSVRTDTAGYQLNRIYGANTGAIVDTLAASTAPAATNTSLVVSLNPNNAANTAPYLMQEGDGTNTTTIKASGAVATPKDTALVVTEREPVYVRSISPPLNPFLQRCNAVRVSNCQP